MALRPLPSAYSRDAIPDLGILYDSVPLYAARKDVPFYVEGAKGLRGPVLELGCGTGRILLPLARSGATVVGIDNSQEMLPRCCAQVAAELEHLLARAGFRIRQVYGDFARASLVDGSPEQVVCAERIR